MGGRRGVGSGSGKIGPAGVAGQTQAAKRGGLAVVVDHGVMANRPWGLPVCPSGFVSATRCEPRRRSTAGAPGGVVRRSARGGEERGRRDARVGCLVLARDAKRRELILS